MYPGQDELLPPVDLTMAGRLVAAAHNRLGWHWWPGTNAIATVPRNGMEPCQQRTACMWGCIREGKASTDRTHWPDLIGKGVRLVPNARVIRIELDRQGLARGAVYIDRTTGKEHLAKASVVVIAANGIGTPRLLLSSSAPGHLDGLCNSSGLVGKRLMLHPTAAVVGLFDAPLESYRGAWARWPTPSISTRRPRIAILCAGRNGACSPPAARHKLRAVGRGRREPVVGRDVPRRVRTPVWPLCLLGHHL